MHCLLRGVAQSAIPNPLLDYEASKRTDKNTRSWIIDKLITLLERDNEEHSQRFKLL